MAAPLTIIPTLTINYTYVGTEGDDALRLTPLPYLPGTQITYTADFTGNGGNDRLTFFLSDYAGASNSVNAIFRGGAGIDTLELDFAGANSVSSAQIGSRVVYSYDAPNGAGTFTADNTVERFVIKGSDFADNFVGSAGDDWLDGRGGLDLFAGSAGNDGYVLDTVGEKVTGELVGGGIDSIWSSMFATYLADSANVENLRMTGGAIVGVGSAAANLITGTEGDNIIAGLGGKDTLYGKGGADTFEFANFGSANSDSIFDFSSDDKLSLDSSVFTGLDSDGGFLAASDFVRGTAATVVGQATVIYNANTGIVSYDADGKGGAAAQDIAFVGKALAFFDAGDILYDGGLLLT